METNLYKITKHIKTKKKKVRNQIKRKVNLEIKFFHVSLPFFFFFFFYLLNSRVKKI